MNYINFFYLQVYKIFECFSSQLILIISADLHCVIINYLTSTRLQQAINTCAKSKEWTNISVVVVNINENNPLKIMNF